MNKNSPILSKSTGNLLTTSPFVLPAALVAIMGLLLTLGTLFAPNLLFLCVGCWALFVMLLPMAVFRHYDFFSPWTLTAIAIFIGSFLRSIYITAGAPDEVTIDELYLLGEQPEYFIWPAVLLICGLFFLALGYTTGQKRSKYSCNRRKRNHDYLYPVAIITLLVSLICTWQYIKLTGGLESESLSSKRTTIADIDLAGADHHTYGVLRVVASVSIFAHLLVLGDALRLRKSGCTWKLILAIALFGTACILPFYASSRGLIALYACLSAAMLYYSGRSHSFSFFRIACLGVFVILIVHFMTISRLSRSDDSAWSKGTSLLGIATSTVVNRSYPGICTTAHIVRAIPDTLEFKYGKTIWIWLIAPIPREIWSGKPLIHIGPEIGTKVYGTRVSGVPPGFIAEMYWNFHLPGVVIGCFLLGRGLRYVQNRYMPTRGGDPFVAALYVAGPMQLGYQVLGHSLGYGLLQTCISWSMMGGLIWLTSASRGTLHSKSFPQPAFSKRSTESQLA